MGDNNIIKLEIIVIIKGAAYSICNLKYNVPKKIHKVFHNECSYDYHFIIKELAEKYLKKILVLEKALKKNNCYSSNRRRSHEN